MLSVTSYLLLFCPNLRQIWKEKSLLTESYYNYTTTEPRRLTVIQTLIQNIKMDLGIPFTYCQSIFTKGRKENLRRTHKNYYQHNISIHNRTKALFYLIIQAQFNRNQNPCRLSTSPPKKNFCVQMTYFPLLDEVDKGLMCYTDKN